MGSRGQETSAPSVEDQSNSGNHHNAAGGVLLNQKTQPDACRIQKHSTSLAPCPN